MQHGAQTKLTFSDDCAEILNNFSSTRNPVSTFTLSRSSSNALSQCLCSQERFCPHNYCKMGVVTLAYLRMRRKTGEATGRSGVTPGDGRQVIRSSPMAPVSILRRRENLCGSVLSSASTHLLDIPRLLGVAITLQPLYVGGPRALGAWSLPGVLSRRDLLQW